MLVFLDIIYSVYPIYQGLFCIEINQTDVTSLKDTITVE
jgi:hypothetical protein